MKIAILFSGRIKKFNSCYKYIMKNIVKDNEVDFFISHEKNLDKKELFDFVNLFKPKKIIENDEIYFDISKYPNAPKVKSKHNIMCMFLNRFKVFNIFKEYCLEKNISYDIIFSHRVDFALNNILNYENYLEKIKEDYLFIPSEHDYGGINDRFAFGNFNTMKTYMNCYNKIYELLENKTPLHPETILLSYLKLTEVKIMRFKINYRFL